MTQITAEFRQAALRRGSLIKTNRKVELGKGVVFSAVVEFANLGFVVNPDELSFFSANDLEKALTEARTVVGADRNMTPIYPGFPKQVEELSTLTLLVEQILHYWTAGAFLPDYPQVVRPGLPIDEMLLNARELKVVSAATAAREVIHDLVLNPVAMSMDDKILLAGAIALQPTTLADVSALTSKAKNHENVQSFVRVLRVANIYSVDELFMNVSMNQNAQRLLRVVLALYSSPSDAKWNDQYELAVYTLADRHSRAVKMNKLPRAVRRSIMKNLGDSTKGFYADELVSRRNLWRRVLRAVHAFDVCSGSDQRRAADIVHSNIEYRTFNSLVEAAMIEGRVTDAITLLAENQPGNLLRRLVALLRLVKTDEEAEFLSDSIIHTGVASTVSTLISAYNGVLSANDEHARVTRVAGLNNSMVDRSDVVKVKSEYITLIANSLKTSLKFALKNKPAPVGVVGVKSKSAVPLMKRDASVTDRVLDRGEKIAVNGSGNVLRVFGHWNNNMDRGGYMDIGAVVLDKNFKELGVCTWNSRAGTTRDWAVYSGDKHVYPGDSAAEFVDVKLDRLKDVLPSARYVAMTVQSWSGFPIVDVDFIAGAMLRNKANSGEVFDPRTLVTAFKPTTSSLQAVPFAFDLKTRKMIWLDTSNGSTKTCVSSSSDTSIGTLVYDEVARPRLTLGELATLWADAHGVETSKSTPVDREALLNLL